ncbi:MAG: DivIVA domain-containing protein [Gemmatimonadetes bacterium]|nr:DivIVA domain-containing protein [Gemmatimonadota bacterium]
MKIGPVDIRNHTFQKRGRGVDDVEVRDYLEMVADRLEEVILEGEALKTRIVELDGEVQEFRKLERSMRDSLLSAERMVDDRVAQAEKEAQIIIKNAELQGEKLLGTAREEQTRLVVALDDLRRQRITYIERFRALLRSQSKILEASVEGLNPDTDPGRAEAPQRSAEMPVSEVTDEAFRDTQDVLFTQGEGSGSGQSG